MLNEILIVDGYNMIGAWPELTELANQDLEAARDRLIHILAEYQGFSGRQVVLVFDAHQVPGTGKKYVQSRLDVRYTKEKETADECIERLVSELTQDKRRRHIHVATSDQTEQRVIFGSGALRISARELWIEIEQSRKSVDHRLDQMENKPRNTFDSRLTLEQRRKLEQWRRKK